MKEIFNQLAGLLTHLGEKPIGVVTLAGYEIRFDWLTLVMSWAVMAILIVGALFLRRALRQPIEDKPNRTQAALDALMGALQTQLGGSFGSERLAAMMFPFVSTLFLYVLFSNWISVIPYMTSPTQDLNVTLGLALLVFVISQVLALRFKGVRRYLKGYVDPLPVMLPINIIGEVAKPLSHAFRLFGNVLAGTIFVTVIMAKFAPIIVPPVLNIIFGLFFGGIQAFVFAILAVAYINVAVQE